MKQNLKIRLSKLGVLFVQHSHKEVFTEELVEKICAISTVNQPVFLAVEPEFLKNKNLQAIYQEYINETKQESN